ncbi:MAG: hypothetical protein WCF12_13145 [Propionicimonas sp.]
MSVTLDRPTAETPRTADAATARILAVPLAGLAILLGAAAGYLATGDMPIIALLFPLLLLPVLLWRQPRLGMYLLLAAAVTIEQFNYAVGPRAGAVTATIPFFHGILPAGMNLAEVLMMMTVVVVVMHAVELRRRWIHSSPVLTMLGAVMGFVMVYLVLGLARGGDLTKALWEVRPFLYLLVSYLLAAALVEGFSAVRPLLWILVLGSGVKALYGISIFLSVRYVEPRPEAILAHEESYLFGLFIITTAAMWLFRFRDPLRTVATALLPVVLTCNMLNSRRTAWLVLIAGLAVLMVVAVIQLRDHRKAVAGVIAAAVLGAGVYLPLFWSQDGTLAQPARAVRSAVAPDSRDEASNDYRVVEDYNVRVYIGQSHSMGLGFGRSITYYGLVDLTEISPMLAYVPHNGVLYLWLRMGAAGVVTFALFVSQAAISAVRLSASRHREAAMMGAITAAILFGYVAMGSTDMGFFWFRNAIVMGTLLGVVDGLARWNRIEHPDRADEGTASIAPAGAIELGTARVGV